MQAIMKDEQLSLEMTQMPFDGTKLMYGGLKKVVVESGVFSQQSDVAGLQ
jgi:uncharacterized protein YbaA (DUF1428 family)